jgi:PAS domain S-box-containing protein
MGVKTTPHGGGWWALLAACTEGVAVTDGGAFAAVSDGFADTHGRSAENLRGRSWRSCYTDAARGRIETEALPSVERDGLWHGDLEASRPDGGTVRQTVVLGSLGDGRVAWAVRDARPADDRTARPYRTLVESFPNGAVSLFDTELRYTVVEGEVFDEVGMDAADLEGERLVDVHSESFLEQYLPHYEAALEGQQREFEFRYGDRWFRAHVIPVRDERGRVVSGVAMTQDITALHEREQTLQRRRDELATLNRINELLLAVTRELVESGDREAVEQAVCERLVDSPLYDLAWVGEPAPDGTGIRVRTSAGDAPGYLEAITVGDHRLTARGPAGEALRTRRVRVATPSAPSMEPWRPAALEQGFAAVAAVPLHDGDRSHGVLLLHTDRSSGFGERERSGLDVLGRTVGFVVGALKRRKLLFSEAVTELTFRVPEPDAVFARTARALDCRLDLEGYVAVGDRWALYVAVEGTGPGDVAAALREAAAVESTRVLDGGTDGGRIEIVAEEPPMLRTVTGGAASIRTASADAEALELVLEAPVDTDARTVAGRVREVYPGAELVAKHERDHRATTLGRPDGVLGELTDRQREALEAAYRAGYFDWPRDSSAEQVADSLGVAGATFHGHLRKAERRLIARLFDEG